MTVNGVEIPDKNILERPSGIILVGKFYDSKDAADLGKVTYPEAFNSNFLKIEEVGSLSNYILERDN